MAPIYTAPNAAGLPYTPYLTVAEYQNDPDAIDTSDLVPGGTPQQNADALYQKIIQASSWMDTFCHYVLGATIDTETCRARIRSDGYLKVPTRGVPIREIEYFNLGLFPSGMASLSNSVIGDIWTEENIIWIPAYLSENSGGRTGVSFFGPGDKVFCQFQYVNGYANTLLSGNVSAGGTSIPVKSSLGIYPGMQLTIYDIGFTETILVDSSYVGGVGASTTIPLQVGTTLQFNHSSGVSVSDLPATAKKAAILATSAHIKTRGGGAMIMESVTEENPGKEESGEAGGVEDLALAASLLQKFRINYYGGSV